MTPEEAQAQAAKVIDLISKLPVEVQNIVFQTISQVQEAETSQAPAPTWGEPTGGQEQDVMMF